MVDFDDLVSTEINSLEIPGFKFDYSLEILSRSISFGKQ